MKRIKHFYLALVFMAIGMQAQEEKDSLQQVIGTVKDMQGNPIRDVLILIDSTNTADIKTNDLGQFTAKVPLGTHVLSAYSKNYGVLDQPYHGEDQVHFQWNADPVKVSRSKLKSLGYVIRTESKKSERAKKMDYTKYQNIYQMLMAEVPGVIANGNKIQLRGTSVSSLNSGIEPLYIVDGTQVGSIEFINPVEVKSFKVIRDEGASIYGVRGANGVIVIELKK